MRRAAIFLALAAACGGSQPSDKFSFDLPANVPAPNVPSDNAMTAEKVELGRRLFYDKKLSLNQTQSCASCHRQSLAFTDGLPQGIGSTGEHNRRAALSLTNVGYNATLTWANSILSSLEAQALVPMFGDHPIELGLAGHEDELLARFSADADYTQRFAAVFPGEKIDTNTITKAIAAFERTLISFDSPYDRYNRGESAAMSDSAKRGMDLFFSEKLECFHCHSGFNLTDSVSHAGIAFNEGTFHNTGLYDLDGNGAYPATDTGLMEQTGNPADMGRFRAPTLRNVAATAPYMHDGSVATLSDVLDHYAAGGRSAMNGHAPSPLRSIFIKGFTLTSDEKADVIAFLQSLTDDRFLNDPRFSNPFK